MSKVAVHCQEETTVQTFQVYKKSVWSSKELKLEVIKNLQVDILYKQRRRILISGEFFLQ